MDKAAHTEIVSNGPMTMGEPPGPLETLYEVLREYSLDPTFERCGDFHTVDSGGIHDFLGGFARLSHIFWVRTNDPETVAFLSGLIYQNQQNAIYQAIRLEQINYWGDWAERTKRASWG